MDPDRVRSYLQVACAGLGFDIGEVWWMTNENGTSTVASITESADTTQQQQQQPDATAANVNHDARPKKRFLQLYTSKAYCNQRSKLVQPHEEVDAEFDNEHAEKEGGTSRSSNDDNASNSHSLVLHNNNNNNIEEDEHVLSPRIVEAVTKSAQVVWANCQSTQQNVGLLGRSDIKLQTAIGMPVGMDDSGHVWVVVMFSPKNIQSSSDAIEYLQYIGRSAGSSSIPCLLPVVGSAATSSSNNGPGPKLIDNGKEEDKKLSSNDDKEQSHYLVSIQPPKTKQSTIQQDILGEGVTAKFVSFNIQDDDYDDMKPNQLTTVHHPRTSSINSENDLRNAQKDDFGIPMLPVQEGNTLDNMLITDAFDEASYGVWSTIMNSASGNAIRTSTMIASKMEIIRERLEEFLCAFLGMSMFDVGDAWVLSSADGDISPGGGVGDDKAKTLKCLFTVAATENNPGVNTFRGVSANSSIQIGDGAVGKAFSSGYPVWSSDKALIYDGSRYQAFQDCNIETVFAVPIFSAGDVSPSCILSCYSLLHAESVPFVVNFVQKAVRLLWDGLDQIVDPHESVGKVLWNNVGPSDLGEMAADLEMQKAFIGKKRPHSDMSRRLSHDLGNEEQEAARHRSSSLAVQINGLSGYDSESAATSYAVPPTKGLSPAPLFPTTVMSPHSQQMVSVNFSDEGHWAVQQAVKSVGDFQQWNSTNDFHDAPAQQQMVYQQEQGQPSQVQPLQYHPEFTTENVGQAQYQQQCHSYAQTDIQAQQQPNYSLAYVDYGIQHQGAAAIPNPPHPNLPTGVHIDPQPVIQANLMEFNAMAQMYSNPESTHPPNHSVEATMNFAPVPAPQVPSQPIENIRVVPLSQAEGSVILTGPQQMMYCTATSQPVYVESMDQRLLNSLDTAKECRITGCSQQAQPRKPYCSKHSGNRSCEREGCTKHAQGATRFCIAHGGGRRCTFPGCDKGARDRFFCAAHGGGKRCKIEGCSKSAVGGSTFCTSHGGGKRCKVEGCDKSAQSSTNFCVKHGGGKKCQFQGCTKVARGKTLFCAAHGGGVRCKLEGCNRVAIGKAQLCRAHGGGACKKVPVPAFMFPPPM